MSTHFLTTWLAIAVLPTLASSAPINWVNNTGGTLFWNVSGNWDGTFPNAPGAEANLSRNFTVADTSIRLGQNITVGSLTICDTAVDTASGFQVDLINTGGYTLTFESAVAGQPTFLTVPTNIVQDPWYNADATIGPPIYLGGTSPLTVRADGELTLNSIYFQGNTLTVTNTTGASWCGFSAELYGAGTSHLVGNTGINFVKYNAGYTGSAEANAGTWTFVGNSSTLGGGLVAAARLTLNEGGLVIVGSGSAYDPNPGQRMPTNTLVFAGGQLNHGGQSLKGAALNQIVGDVLQWIAVSNGESRVQLTAAASTAGTYVRAKTLTREPGALLVIAADKLGGNLDTTTRGQQFQVDAAPAGIGAGGAEGTTTMNVLPWLFCRNHYYGHGPDRIGTVSANGLRGLLDTELDATLAGTDTRNVRVTSAALTADQRVNSIIFSYYNASNLGAGRTLRVTSGAVLLSYDSTRLGEIGSASAGTLDFGTAEGCVYVNSAAEAASAVGAVIAGSGGLTTGAWTGGRLRLTAANTYSGPTTVAGGILQVGDGTAATATARVGAGDVRICAAAVLRVASAVTDAIPDTSAVTLDSAGLKVGRLDLQTGVTETVKYLNYGGTPQPVGTYGSTSSGAEFQDNRYFVGPGVLNVTAVAGRAPSVTVITVR